MALVKKARGTRSYGCAALEMVYVATGRIDAYVTPRLSPWTLVGTDNCRGSWIGR